MARRPLYGDSWSESPIERAGRMVEEVYNRTLSRQVIWSPVKRSFDPQEENCEKYTLEEAFESVMYGMQQVSRACKRYHSNCEKVKGYEDSVEHCQRFHSEPPPVHRALQGNLRENTVQLTLPKGLYSVTAHHSGSRRKTSIMQVGNPDCLTLDFHL